jgi:hypothetical protein
MSTATEQSPALDEAAWNVWIEKGKRQERATARNAKVMGGILLVLLAIGSLYYFFRL